MAETVLPKQDSVPVVAVHTAWLACYPLALSMYTVRSGKCLHIHVYTAQAKERSCFKSTASETTHMAAHAACQVAP
jgi:hypothetical protein